MGASRCETTVCIKCMNPSALLTEDDEPFANRRETEKAR